MIRLGFLLLLSGILTRSPSAAPLPGGFDHSGWYEFEVVVLVNAEPEVLQSETWPLLPQPAYPSRWRWLLQHPSVEEESLLQENAHVLRSRSGHTMIYDPEPAPVLWLPTDAVLTQGDLDLINELIDLGMGSTSEDREMPLLNDDPEALEPTPAGSADLVLPFEASDPEVPTQNLLSLESLVLDGTPNRAEQKISVPFAPPEQRTELLPVVVTATPIPLPATFEKLPLKKLAAGLRRYRRSNSDEVIAATSWLQGPSSENLPIIIEPEGGNGYPPAQGFIQVVPRANGWRLGLNIWANTQGQYLPDIFEMEAPPPSPPSTTRVAAARSPLDQASGISGASDALQLSDGTVIKTAPTVGEPMDPTDDSAPLGNAMDSDPGHTQQHTAPLPPEWDWRHLIHVADTVPLTENRLRYYDHPVIKVLAIWRELSWYELYRRGALLKTTEQPAAD